jgi:DNA primase
MAPTGYRRERGSRFAKAFPAARPFPNRKFAPEVPLTASPQLAASPMLRGHLAAVPRREALMILTIVNHPWLLHDHLEEFSQAEFRHRDAGRLKEAVIDTCSHDASIEAHRLRSQLGVQGLGGLLARIEQAITTASVWGVRPDAAPDDVRLTWRQLLALHRQWYSLIKELKDAERALGQEGSEANYSWLCDVKARLSGIDGMEALVEGFEVRAAGATGRWGARFFTVSRSLTRRQRQSRTFRIG